MKVTQTKLTGVLKIIPKIFEDYRGVYIESYNYNLYYKEEICVDFIQDDYSISSRNVLRGLHGDYKTWKLVMCPVGRLLLAVVDCNEGSENFGQWETFVLSERNHHQILIPPGFANGHLVMSEKAMFSYKQSTYYEPDSQFTYAWNNPMFNINWPIEKPILSERDSTILE